MGADLRISVRGRPTRVPFPPTPTKSRCFAAPPRERARPTNDSSSQWPCFDERSFPTCLVISDVKFSVQSQRLRIQRAGGASPSNRSRPSSLLVNQESIGIVVHVLQLAVGPNEVGCGHFVRTVTILNRCFHDADSEIHLSIVDHGKIRPFEWVLRSHQEQRRYLELRFRTTQHRLFASGS